MKEIIITTTDIKSFFIGAIAVILVTIAIQSAAAPISAENSRIINLATPTASTDAATKAYVDGINESYNAQTCSGASGCTATCNAGTYVLQAWGASSTASSFDGCTGSAVAAYGPMLSCWGSTSCTISNCGSGNEGLNVLCGK